MLVHDYIIKILNLSGSIVLWSIPANACLTCPEEWYNPDGGSHVAAYVVYKVSDCEFSPQEFL